MTAQRLSSAREKDLVLSRGNWYQDDILAYEKHEVESFTWQDDNRIYIDVKV